MTLGTTELLAVAGVLGCVISLLFRYMVGSFQDRIADLKRENERLTGENERLWSLVRGITPVAAEATRSLSTALGAVEQQARGHS